MSIRTILKSEQTAWLLGAFVLSAISGFVFSWIGWLGIGIVGLVGLVISTRVGLHDGHALADSGFGSGDVPMYARQLDEARKSQASLEQKMAAEAERARRSRTLELVNAVFITMAVLGFWFFIRHQLELF